MTAKSPRGDDDIKQQYAAGRRDVTNPFACSSLFQLPPGGGKYRQLFFSELEHAQSMTVARDQTRPSLRTSENGLLGTKRSLIAAYIKGYRGTWMFVLLGITYAYVGRPVEPWMPAALELHEIAGMPEFRHSPSSKSAVGSDYFVVNNVRLNCSYGHLGGMGGCEMFRKAIDLKRPVHATYFWMPVRIWFLEARMLHELTQDGRRVISMRQSSAERARNYRRGWRSYYQLVGFGLVVTTILWFIERTNLKRNKTQLPRE